METDPKKLRELRLHQPHMTSAEAYAQMERSLQAASRRSQPTKPAPSASGRKRAA
jgi:hypothetical protein